MKNKKPARIQGRFFEMFIHFTHFMFHQVSFRLFNNKFKPITPVVYLAFFPNLAVALVIGLK